MRKKTDNITRVLHWGFAFFVLAMLGLGFYMTNTEYTLELYQWHKSLGVVFSMIIGIRIYWSLKHPWQSATTLNRNEILAQVVVIHRLLLVLLMAMPIAGKDKQNR